MSLPESDETWRSLLARVESTVGRLMGHGSDCDDVVQNTFVRLLRASRRGVSIQCLEAWLARVSRREVAKWQRSQRRSLPLCPDGDDLEVASRDGSPVEIPWAVLLERASAALPAVMGGWFTDLLSGKEDAEVALRNGVSEVAVRKRWSRLRDLLGDRGILARILDISVTIEALRDFAGSDGPAGPHQISSGLSLSPSVPQVSSRLRLPWRIPHELPGYYRRPGFCVLPVPWHAGANGWPIRHQSGVGCELGFGHSTRPS